MVRNKHNIPGIIKYPFWRMTTQNPQAGMPVSTLAKYMPRGRLRTGQFAWMGTLGKLWPCFEMHPKY